MIKFEFTTSGDVDRLFWVHDLELSEGHTFYKKK